MPKTMSLRFSSKRRGTKMCVPLCDKVVDGGGEEDIVLDRTPFLFLLMLYFPVNNFSVMLGRFPVFLG